MPLPNRQRKNIPQGGMRKAKKFANPKKIVAEFPFRVEGRQGRPWNPMTIQLVRIARLMFLKSRIIRVPELFERTAAMYKREIDRRAAGKLLKRILHRLIQKKVFVRIPGTQNVGQGVVLRKPPAQK